MTEHQEKKANEILSSLPFVVDIDSVLPSKPGVVHNINGIFNVSNVSKLTDENNDLLSILLQPDLPGIGPMDEGFEASVVVSFIEAPNDFWCCIRNKQSPQDYQAAVAMERCIK